MSEFAGRTALITGAASGIGLAAAQRLAGDGIAELVLVDLDQAGLEAVDPPCRIRRYCGDVADEALWDRIEREVAHIDFAALNAGIADSAPIPEIDLAGWRRILSTNLDGMMLSLRFAMRRMLPASAGSVVMTASISGLKAEPGTAAYAASKAAVIQLARVAAREAAPHKVRVNAIAPGGVDTPIWDSVPMFREFVAQHGGRDQAIAAMGQLATPLGRYASADEIAGQIAFLLSDSAASITGTVLVSDGGYSL